MAHILFNQLKLKRLMPIGRNMANHKYVEHKSVHNGYEDFDINIGEPTESHLEPTIYPVQVQRSPGGEARSQLIFPFSNAELDVIQLRLEKALLRSGGKQRRMLTPDEQTIQEFGAALFDALFTDEIRSLYEVSLERAAQAGKGLRIQLRIAEPVLATLPWEYLFDTRHNRYLALSNRTPIVRYLDLPQPAQPLLSPTPLRILGMIASPSDIPTLDVVHEKQRVEELYFLVKEKR